MRINKSYFGFCDLIQNSFLFKLRLKMDGNLKKKGGNKKMITKRKFITLLQ